MKRIGNLWPRIADPDNLKLAFSKAARGKRDRVDVRKFQANYEDNVQTLRTQLETETYRLGDYQRFKVFDPKERIIHAAAFPERVLHHAVMNICEPAFENRLSGAVFACRKGRGQYGALDRAQKAMRSGGYYLQLDIRKYFDSIPHGPLYRQLSRIFKDKALLRFWERLLHSYEVSSGRGLPIGSLTSQHLANSFLAPLDNWIHAQTGCTGYVRYMDDFIIWSRQKTVLRDLRPAIEHRLATDFELQLKHAGILQPVRVGVSFLGYRVFSSRVHLNRRSRRRFIRRGSALVGEWLRGYRSDADLQDHLLPLTAFAAKADDHLWRRRAVGKIWARAIGHEPRQPRRQLEQHRAELSFRQSQQEQAGQHEEQPRLPPRSQLRGCAGWQPWID